MPLFTDSLAPNGWAQALDHMQSALKLLDESDAPEDASPHLDLAICRLEQAIGGKGVDKSMPSLRHQIEEALAAVMSEHPKEVAAPVW